MRAPGWLLLMALGASVGAGPPPDHERVLLRTAAGDLLVRLEARAAPQHVDLFRRLVKAGALNGTRFDRIEPGVALRLGRVEDRPAPLTPGQRALLREPGADPGGLPHQRGALTMGPWPGAQGTEGSFSIQLGHGPAREPTRTVFGVVERGFEVLDRISRFPTRLDGTPIEPLGLTRALVLAAPDLARLELVGPPADPPLVGPSASSPDRRVSGPAEAVGLLLLGLAGLGLGITGAAGRVSVATLRSLGMLVSLGAFALGLVVLVPATPGEGGLGTMLFLGTLLTVRVLSDFETGPAEAVPAPRDLAPGGDT